MFSGKAEAHTQDQILQNKWKAEFLVFYSFSYRALMERSLAKSSDLGVKYIWVLFRLKYALANH